MIHLKWNCNCNTSNILLCSTSARAYLSGHWVGIENARASYLCVLPNVVTLYSRKLFF